MRCLAASLRDALAHESLCVNVAQDGTTAGEPARSTIDGSRKQHHQFGIHIMSTKQMKFSSAAQQEFKAGVRQIARAVAITMGPTGRNVVLQKSFGGPTITKDGVTVAKEI